MSETLTCFLPAEKLVFHSELLAPVLFLQTLRRHVFWHLHPQIYFATFLLFLREWLLCEYVFLTSAVPLATLSNSLREISVI